MSVKDTVEMMPEVDELSAIPLFIESIAENAGWPFEFAYQVEIIVEELCINVIKHGQSDGSRPIIVEIESNDERVKIEISDNGKAFDPTLNREAPEKITSIENSEIGGWGLHLADTFSDEMHYKRIDDTNCLTLVKRRTG